MVDYILEMKSIYKSFGSNEVLHGVNFQLKPGEIHALLGENGTGKSTLMNILGGVFPAQSGEIILYGEPITVSSPADAQKKGIAFIHQELTLINDLAIYENLFLGNELKKGGFLDVAEMCKQSRKVLEHMGVKLDPKTLVSELDTSYKQIVEIARALLRNAKILIMDEPTTALTEIEIQSVFKIMTSLKKQGVSIVFISHKLKEVVAICDSHTVMRDGNNVVSGKIDDQINETILAKFMVGKDLSDDELYASRKIGSTVLEVRKLSYEREFHDISFKVSKGEIVGFTGLLGDGRSELFQTIFGCNKNYSGDIYMNGVRQLMHTTTKACSCGIGYVPRNRKENGIIRDMSVKQNMSISIMNKLKKFLFIDQKKEKKLTDQFVNDLNIKVSCVDDLITSLSGGNQQKVILSRWLAANPQIIVLDNPTQGVDIGAKLEIYHFIMRLAEQGMSVIVLSSEAQEVLKLCDRIYVMYHGEIRKEFLRTEADAEKIMIVATGGNIA
ncbi:MAG TPA: ABC transporter [Firmicutes bacterium]|jgi:ribose transport system ATP-binding protein|nr:ABC transporter [Bacillota bacterium]